MRSGRPGRPKAPDGSRSNRPELHADPGANILAGRSLWAPAGLARPPEMFDSFVRLAQARHALKGGDHEACLRLLADPSLREHRRIEKLRSEALDGFEERIRARVVAGDLEGARSGIEQLRRFGAPAAQIAGLEGELDASDRASGGLEERLSVQGNGVRDALDRGALIEARAAWERAKKLVRKDADPRRLRLVERWGEEIEQRTLQARAALDAARDSLGAERSDRAADEFARARRLDADVAARSDLGSRIARDLARTLARESATEGGFLGLREAVERLPDLAVEPRFRRAFDLAQDRVRARLQKLIDDGQIEEAIAVAEADGDFDEIAEPLRDGLRAERLGHDVAAAGLWADLAKRVGSKSLGRRSDDCRERSVSEQERQNRLRALLDNGEVEKVETELTGWLTERPDHERARALAQEVESQQEAFAGRLRQVEELRDAGRVGAALGQLQTIRVGGAHRGVLDGLRQELEQKRRLVTERREELLRELHGRTSGSAEGVQHLISRAEELRRLRCDDPELERLHRALVSEHDGLVAIEEMREKIRLGRVDGVSDAARLQIERRADLLDPDRLRARETEIVELATAHARRQLDLGRPGEAREWLDAVARFGASDSASLLDEKAQRALDSAAELARRGLELLADSKVDQAREKLAEARAIASDCPGVRRLERALDGGLERLDVLERAEKGIARRDFGAAAAALREIGPTPAGLRTQVFDLKRNLAEAQGLGDVFVLRVDDAGEFLVARGESVSIGNLREGLADLPMLARLKGLHARLRRSMSFHGGQVDCIEAEAGGLFDREGRACERIDLEGPTRFRLGDAVGFRYHRPSDRSLSANLTVHGGFRVGGCERLVWMKDRGRDGRVLLGPARDAHVQLSQAVGEVELYAERDGRVYVSVDGEGEIDGRPFVGRHPVVPGAVVRAVGLEFVVVPWSRD